MNVIAPVFGMVGRVKIYSTLFHIWLESSLRWFFFYCFCSHRIPLYVLVPLAKFFPVPNFFVNIPFSLPFLYCSLFYDLFPFIYVSTDLLVWVSYNYSQTFVPEVTVYWSKQETGHVVKIVVELPYLSYWLCKYQSIQIPVGCSTSCPSHKFLVKTFIRMSTLNCLLSLIRRTSDFYLKDLHIQTLRCGTLPSTLLLGP